MRYVERVLQPGERVVYLTSLHWLVYLRAAVLVILAVAAAIGSGFVAEPYAVLGLRAAALLLAVWGLFAAVGALVRRATTELAITDRRVIFKAGALRRHTVEINRSKVETVGVNQSLLGRLLGYGTVIVRGTGGSFEPIPYIGDPLTFRNHITAG